MLQGFALNDERFMKVRKSNQEYFKRLLERIKLIRTSERMFYQKITDTFAECSIDNQNYPNAKAMLKPRKRIKLKMFYFSTNTSSMRVNQYKNNPNASIYFYYKGLIKYVGIMLKGKMEVLMGQETKNRIWKKGDTMFYKKGVTDSDYCVLKFTATSGRYYCDLKTENFDIK